MYFYFELGKMIRSACQGPKPNLTKTLLFLVQIFVIFLLLEVGRPALDFSDVARWSSCPSVFYLLMNERRRDRSPCELDRCSASPWHMLIADTCPNNC